MLGAAGGAGAWETTPAVGGTFTTQYHAAGGGGGAGVGRVRIDARTMCTLDAAAVISPAPHGAVLGGGCPP
jgi:hypothetical protein